MSVDAGNNKVLINLATGLEDPERVLVAFLVAGAALTKEAVRLALPGHAVGVACGGCPPLEGLFEQVAEKGGELLVCRICLKARGLDGAELLPSARVAGATPLWEWIGEGATVFSY